MEEKEKKQVELAENELNDVAGGMEDNNYWIDDKGGLHWQSTSRNQNS